MSNLFPGSEVNQVVEKVIRGQRTLAQVQLLSLLARWPEMSC